MDALNVYKYAQATTSSPAELVVMLYRGAIRFTVNSIEAIEAGNHERAHHGLVRAQAIVAACRTAPGIDTQSTAPDYALSHLREMFVTSTGTADDTTLTPGSCEPAEVDLGGVERAHQLAASWVADIKRVLGTERGGDPESSGKIAERWPVAADVAATPSSAGIV
jgi:hypothetical protein